MGIWSVIVETKKKGTTIPQNKFKALKSRVIQCGVEEKMIRKVGVAEVKCFKCGKKGHKCRECLLWEKKRVICMVKPQKV